MRDEAFSPGEEGYGGSQANTVPARARSSGGSARPDPALRPPLRPAGAWHHRRLLLPSS